LSLEEGRGDGMSDGKQTVTIRIDGRWLEADPAQTVLQVALANGIEIPYFCYHPSLSVVGNCRQCQVRIGMRQPDDSIRWMPKLQVSCNTAVAPGMVVDTCCPEVRAAQAANMEFLLINHPLDCPICDQVGECWLQEHAYTAGPGETRFRESKLHFDKRADIGPHVLLDKERCIQCTRCIRFCDEVTGTSELALLARGNRTEVDIFPGRPLDNPYSGNVVDLCPVGALTLKEFRFKSRLWFLQTASTVCPGCARGCNIKVWHRDRKISRITPRDNEEVNGSWICDEGRLIHENPVSGERLQEPFASSPSSPALPVSWSQALDAAADLLRQAGDAAAGLFHAGTTLEEAYLALRILGRDTGSTSVAVPLHKEGSDDDLLIRADRTPNRRGLTELLHGLEPGLVTTEALLEQAARGELSTLLVLGEDLASTADIALLDNALAAGLKLIVLAGHESPTVTRGAVVLPSAVYPEVDGTVVSFRGRVQRVTAAYPPPFQCRPGIAILGELAARLNAGEANRPARELFDELAGAVPAFHGLASDNLGDLGAWLPSAATAGSA
jgi:NADH-quinone oxidoreductase subunit G